MDKNYGLTLTTTISQAKSFTVKDIHQFTDIAIENQLYNGFIVSWLDSEVMTARWENGKDIVWSHDNFIASKIQKIRIFNKESEVYIWRTKEGYKARFRTDTSGEPCEYVQANQVLFGTCKKKDKEGFTKLYEDRGTEMILPFSFESVPLPLEGTPNLKQRIAIQTRTYIHYNTNHQAQYNDSRFVNFIQLPDNQELY
jgi:CRISPR-associated protein (TIGR03984 family)